MGRTVLLTGAALLADEPLDQLIQQHQDQTFDVLEVIGDFMRKPQHNYPLMLIIWGGGVIFKNEWLRDTDLMIMALVSASGLIQTFAKKAVG